MPIVAGHNFRCVAPGEFCQNLDSCRGEASLMRLIELAEIVKVGDDNIAHTGALSSHERESILQAKKDLMDRMGQTYRS